MSALNKIYEQQYLKSVGEDDDSKKRKREEARNYIDEWIEEQYDRTDYERVYRQGESGFSTKKQKLIQQMETDIRIQNPGMDQWCVAYKEECKKIKKRVEKELGTQEEYATEFAEKHFAPYVSFGLIISIRDLLD